MNCKRSNQAYLGMVLLHFAVVGVLLFIPGFTMGIVTNLFVSEALLAVPALTALLLSGEKPALVLNFRRIRVTSVLMVVVFTFLMGPLTTLLNALSMLFVDNAVTSMSGQILEYPFPVMLFMMAIFGPMCEEICFRGIIYRGFLKSGNVVGAILLSSLLFGLVHMNFNQAPYAFVLGVAMALLMEATGSLWAPVLMHMLFNSQSVILMYIYDRFLPGALERQAAQPMTPELMIPSICMYLVIALACTALAGCVLVWLCRNQGRGEYLTWLWRERLENRKAGKEMRLASPALIVGIVLSLAYMLFMAVMQG